MYNQSPTTSILRKESPMNYQELLFAAHTRLLAVELRHAKLQTDAEAIEDTDELKQFISDWLKENPIKDYIPEALEKIREVAEQIKKLT